MHDHSVTLALSATNTQSHAYKWAKVLETCKTVTVKQVKHFVRFAIWTPDPLFPSSFLCICEIKVYKKLGGVKVTGKKGSRSQTTRLGNRHHYLTEDNRRGMMWCPWRTEPPCGSKCAGSHAPSGRGAEAPSSDPTTPQQRTSPENITSPHLAQSVYLLSWSDCIRGGSTAVGERIRKVLVMEELSRRMTQTNLFAALHVPRLGY